MAVMGRMKDIIKNGLCLGCGLCEAVDEKCRMEINGAGFYRPVPIPSAKEKVRRIRAICPGTRVESVNKGNTEAWGYVKSVSQAWATDKEIRHSSASGGVTTALALYLLESKRVDAVLHVGVSSGDWLHNRLYVSRNREELLSHNGSRYAPALVFPKLFEILEADKEAEYCFIGKPCDVAAVRNVMKEYPEYEGRIPYCLAIFCAGMPSYNATKRAVKSFGKSKEPVSVRYRGEGWPGYFTVKYDDGTEDRMTYNDSWGKILGKDIGFRCKICPDGIGLLADVSSGDSWNTKDGYPDFTETDGRNFCFVRTSAGQELFDEAAREGYIETQSLDVNSIRFMQRYQYARRHIVGWRIAAVQLMTRNILKFKGLEYMKMALKTNYVHALKDALGTCKRLIKVKRGGVICLSNTSVCALSVVRSRVSRMGLCFITVS